MTQIGHELEIVVIHKWSRTGRARWPFIATALVLLILVVGALSATGRQGSVTTAAPAPKAQSVFDSPPTTQMPSLEEPDSRTQPEEDRLGPDGKPIRPPEPTSGNRATPAVADNDLTEAGEPSSTEWRRELATMPVEQQVEAHLEAARVGGVGEAELRAQARVTVTLANPIPVEFLDRQVPGERATPWQDYEGKYAVPDSATHVTLYGEMADGYPFAMAGPIDADLIGSIERFFETAKEAGKLNYDPSSVRGRLAIIGFSLRLDDYAKVEAGLEQRFGRAIAVVSMDPNPSALKPLEGLGSGEIDSLLVDFEAERIGD